MFSFRCSFARDNFWQTYVLDAVFSLAVALLSTKFADVLSVYRNQAKSTSCFLPDVSYSEVKHGASNIGVVYRFLSQQLKFPLPREGWNRTDASTAPRRCRSIMEICRASVYSVERSVRPWPSSAWAHRTLLIILSFGY